MPRVLWLTDIHLNHVRGGENAFLDRVAAHRADVVLIGGDISESGELLGYLRLIAERVPGQICFVLGNHDYYFGSIRQVRTDVRALCRELPRLTYLTDADVVPLSAQVGLVGHDGWADARLGDYERSLVMMYDYRLIAELAAVDKAARWPLLQALGEEAAATLRARLAAGLAKHDELLLLTHVPPFREACWYRGQISNDEWLPHFTCHALGQMLLAELRQRPQKRLTVLCGHTHSAGEAWPLPNLHVITGGNEYGRPMVQRLFELA